MDKELSHTLKEKYPRLYKIMFLTPESGEKYWEIQLYGVTCDNGWYGIIDRLSSKLEKELDKQDDCSPYYAVQVKSKFGGLRFYMSNATHTMQEYISEAESESFMTCELCGRMGGQAAEIRHGWISTICVDCRPEM